METVDQLLQGMLSLPLRCDLYLKFFECRKLKLSAKLEIKLIYRKVAKEKLTDGQSNLLFSTSTSLYLRHETYSAIIIYFFDDRW